MGLFDWVRCAAPLDSRVNSQDIFQTKSLDCCMSMYWIDPSGQLWQIDESGTYDFVEESEENINNAIEKKKWFPSFYTRPNGAHGKVRAHHATQTISIYPSDWRSKLKDKLYHSDWPEYDLTFRNGKLILFQILS